MNAVPALRIRDANAARVRDAGEYVLYWMIANRRLNYNFALDRALEHCRELRKPLVIFEALRCGYAWASERLHRFVIDGMAEHAALCAQSQVAYYPYVEPQAGDGRGLLEEFATRACLVVTDEFPCCFLPRMVAAAGRKLPVKLEAVDSNGLLPVRATERVFMRAFDFRRYLQKSLAPHLAEFPAANPLGKAKLEAPAAIAKKISACWPAASPALLAGEAGTLERLPIDHQVKPATLRGGGLAARTRMKDFFARKLADYAGKRNQPELDVSSGFSPYLHFGFLSAHEVLHELARHENWTPKKLALRANGSREGWWNMSRAAEAFLDELVTWRELSYNFSSHREDYDQYASLPGWAQKTLQQHARDERTHIYTLEEFAAGATHDPLWNAAQMQIVREGWMHNYLRMLWGKKILEWTRTPQQAASIMIELNNKYGLDGRNPNSYSGIFWVLGRYDRPWGPERPIYGQIRYMTSENTARKLSVKNYIAKYAPKAPKAHDEQAGQARLFS
ncbi:MAG: deoxyribodipyrimidine photolyase [Candidatus Acidiferrum sp.]